MALGRPIVTTDLDFAHATCGDAAIYFSAGDPQAAANAVLGLIGDPVLWARCLSQGRRVLSALPDAQAKFRLYVEAIRATAVAGRH
jgi:glycosyltransferase involved in cell wall biosynthesis